MNTLYIAACLLCGMAVGHFLPGLNLAENADGVVSVLLYIMLFLVGLDLGAKNGLRAQVKRIGLDAIGLPAAVAIGSILGGLVAGALLPVGLWQGAAVGAGFGWYSLSSVLLGKVDAVLGAQAFLTNVLREILALVFIPVLVKVLHPWVGIAAGGATAMDTTLPVVVKSAGSEYAIHSFISGVLLSMAVPVAISTILAVVGVK